MSSESFPPQPGRLDDVLRRYAFPPEVLDAFAGIGTLYPPQDEAVRRGVLDGKNLLLAVPTASGKTLVAELAILRALVQGQGRCLYIVPLKALANEKYQDFKKRFSPLGFRVGMATGDSPQPDELWRGYHLLIATAEKVDSLLRGHCDWLIQSLKAVVFDEIHFIGDGSRGPVLEVIAARIKQINPAAQMLGLSATVGNAKEIAGWLDAALVSGTWRPIPLKEGVYADGIIQFKDHPARRVTEEGPDDLFRVAKDALKSGGQLLVFVNSRRGAQTAAKELTSAAGPLLTPEERTALKTLSREIVGGPASATKMCRQLGDMVAGGAAFHHAGLKPLQRDLIEDAFKKRLIKIICSTPTLAAGVNLPARRVVIRDHQRFEDGLGTAHIPVSEYKQCAGRAGRPQYDLYGEAVLMSKGPAEAKALYQRYILAPPEPVFSQLGQESALRGHILAAVAGGYVHDIHDTFDFLSRTFFVHQRREENLIDLVGRIFDYLHREDLVEQNGFRFFATPFGQLTSRLYLDPASAVILRTGLRKMENGKSFSPAGILHMISCCPDATLLRPSQHNRAEVELFGETCQDELILCEEDVPSLSDVFFRLSVLRTTLLLTRWMEEEKEDALCDAFGIGPGDIYRHNESRRWLLRAGTALAGLWQYRKLTPVLDALTKRLEYGVKDELIPLTHIKGVGRVRARLLFENGYKTPAAVKEAGRDALAGLEKIGPALAEDILRQLTAPGELLTTPSVQA